MGHGPVFEDVLEKQVSAMICLNVSLPNSHVEILMLDVMILGGGAFGW